MHKFSLWLKLEKNDPSDLPGGSVVKNHLSGDVGSIPGSERSSGEGNGYPLQYSLEKPMDRGAWWATVCGVAKRWTQLKRLAHTHTLTHAHTHSYTHSCKQSLRHALRILWNTSMLWRWSYKVRTWFMTEVTKEMDTTAFLTHWTQCLGIISRCLSCWGTWPGCTFPTFCVYYCYYKQAKHSALGIKSQIPFAK